MTTTRRLTRAAQRDLEALRNGELVDLRYGPWRQLTAAGYITGPQDAPALVEVVDPANRRECWPPSEPMARKVTR